MMRSGPRKSSVDRSAGGHAQTASVWSRARDSLGGVESLPMPSGIRAASRSMRPTSWEQRAGVDEHEREMGMPLVQSSEHEPQHGGRRVDQEAERRDEGVGVH